MTDGDAKNHGRRELTTNSLIREINALRCFRSLRGTDPLSRSEIGRRLKMSRATVGNAIKPLLEKGFVMEREEPREQPSSAGRPGILVQINPTGAYFIGIDISTTEINAVLIDLAMGLMAKYSVPIASEYRYPGKVVEHFATLPQQLLKIAGLSSKQLAGLGVSVPGLVSNAGRVVSAPGLGWKDFDLQNALLKKWRSRWPVLVINDAVGFASAVQAGAPDRELGDVLLILLTEGIGSARIQEGKISAGGHGFAGEIGHMIMDPKVHLGVSKTFEDIAGSKHFLPLLRPGCSVAQGLEELSTLDKPTRKLNKALREWADAFSTGLLNLIHIIDPGRIVLGGPLSVIYPLVEDRVLDRLSSGLMYGLKIPPISVDKFGGDDAAVGAAAAVREKLFALPELRSY